MLPPPPLALLLGKRKGKEKRKNNIRPPQLSLLLGELCPASSVRPAGCSPGGQEPPCGRARGTSFLLTAVLVPPGIPSSHCSAFVYREARHKRNHCRDLREQIPAGTCRSCPLSTPTHFSGSRHFLHGLRAPALGSRAKEEWVGVEEQDARRRSPACWTQSRWSWSFPEAPTDVI